VRQFHSDHHEIQLVEGEPSLERGEMHSHLRTGAIGIVIQPSIGRVVEDVLQAVGCGATAIAHTGGEAIIPKRRGTCANVSGQQLTLSEDRRHGPYESLPPTRTQSVRLLMTRPSALVR
jgi:hypothetical protein